MKTDLFDISENGLINYSKENISDKSSADIILVFAQRELIESVDLKSSLSQYSSAETIICSSAGEILDIDVYDESIACTAISFEKTSVKTFITNIEGKTSESAGRDIALNIDQQNLSHVMIFSDGGLVNGTDLMNGINEVFENKIMVTGGLAGDGAKFEKTIVGLNDNIQSGNIVSVALYSNDLKVRHGSRGGWKPFGPIREITKSASNILYELDDKNALDLYKEYLGDKVDGLPGSALLFPLMITLENGTELVRTILSVNETDGSMTFAGNVPEGCKAQLMLASDEELIDGAAMAAEDATSEEEPELVLLVSCIGRKLVLGPRVDEEIDAVKEQLGESATYIGFYSYGEICPLSSNVSGDLHNQTMTITTFKE